MRQVIYFYFDFKFVFRFLLFQDISEITPEKLALGDLVEENGNYFYSSTNVFRVLEETGTVRQGPSKADEREYPGRLTADRVYSYPCRSWPIALCGWTIRKREYGWPNEFLIMMSMSKGCFLVPVGHKLSDSSDVEWRLSPSLAERMLIFSLNETHIKCYVLLKHIVKYFVKPILGPSLTSFHCKTAVLTLAERTPWEMWTPGRLMECMDMCLRQLISWCGAGWCPNYLLPQENLFAGRMNTRKLTDLMEILFSVYNSHWMVLLGIDDWGLGETLQLALTGSPYIVSNNEEETLPQFGPSVKIECSSNETLFENILDKTEKAVEVFISHQWSVELAINVLQILVDADDRNEDTCFRKLLKAWQKVSDDKERLNEPLVQDVFVSIMPVLCLYTGSVISSLPGRRGNKFWWSHVYAEWIQPCFKQYIELGTLKLATILLSRGEEFDRILNLAKRLLDKLDDVPEGVTDMGLIKQLMLCQKVIDDVGNQDDFRIIECLLDHIEHEHLESVVSFCPCRLKSSFQKYYNRSRITLQGNAHFTSCVFFMRGEMNIVPYPLQFEFYRSSAADRETRDPYKEQWMDLAVVDTIVYLYFLQYECYRHQRNQKLRETTLLKLRKCVEEDELFHKETALNLLGYCLLLEDRIADALNVYSKSLRIQPSNNCATWHIALMVNKLLHMSADNVTDHTNGESLIRDKVDVRLELPWKPKRWCGANGYPFD